METRTFSKVANEAIQLYRYRFEEVIDEQICLLMNGNIYICNFSKNVPISIEMVRPLLFINQIL